MATWSAPREGRIHLRAEIDATALLAYCAQVRSRTGARVGPTHVVGAALGRALTRVPEVRRRVVLGRLVPYPRSDVGFAVDVGGADLAPVTVRGADVLSPAQVAERLAAGAARLRAGDDRAHGRSMRWVRAVPTPLAGPALRVAGLLVGGLGVPAFGQPAFPLGAAFVSDVGSLGIDEAFLAPLPFARVPLYLAVGAVRDAPMVVDGAVQVRPRLVLVATADHRVIDGAQAARVAAVVRELLADPTAMDPT